MSLAFKRGSVNYAPFTPFVVAECGLRLQRRSSVRGPFKSPLFSVRPVWHWLHISFISDACHRRSESALLTDTTVVELNAEVFGYVLDLDDELGSFLAFFNPARNVPVEVEVDIE